MGNQFDKHFTLAQANAMIPHVRKLFTEVHALLAPATPDAVSPDPFTFPPRNGHTSGNGNGNGNGHTNGSHKGGDISQADLTSTTDYSTWSDEKRHEAAYRLLNALQTQGIVIQDVERGLIDFPAIQNGHEVFLCYELSDGFSIQYFHDIEAGYAGRQPITETNE